MKDQTISLKPPIPIKQSSGLVKRAKPKIKGSLKDNLSKIDLEVKV